MFHFQTRFHYRWLTVAAQPVTCSTGWTHSTLTQTTNQQCILQTQWAMLPWIWAPRSSSLRPQSLQPTIRCHCSLRHTWPIWWSMRSLTGTSSSPSHMCKSVRQSTIQSSSHLHLYSFQVFPATAYHQSPASWQFVCGCHQRLGQHTDNQSQSRWGGCLVWCCHSTTADVGWKVSNFCLV